jgi:A/G-specific adenine glycosylase
MTSELALQHFSIPLLTWYEAHQRDLPWRQSRDPYYIWVSEIMLQQTRVDTVIPYFQRFISKFPTIEALAQAKEEEVLKAWEGLGYYSRARHLHSAVREVNEKYGGIVPSDKHQLASLKGVGPYTTGAILSIAYHQPEPAVDGNVMRVLSRYFLIEEDITQPRTRIKMEQLAKSLIVPDRAADFTQALMEIGALICTPRSPACLLCPVMEHCAARMAGLESTLPYKKKSKAPRQELRLVALILQGTQEISIQVNAHHKVELLFRQRPQQGLLAKMWEMPHIQWHSSQWSDDEEHIQFMQHHFLQTEGLSIQPLAQAPANGMMEIDHVFSHIHWKLKVYPFYMASDWLPYHYRWISEEHITAYAFPQVFLKIMENVQKS